MNRPYSPDPGPRPNTPEGMDLSSWIEGQLLRVSDAFEGLFDLESVANVDWIERPQEGMLRYFSSDATMAYGAGGYWYMPYAGSLAWRPAFALTDAVDIDYDNGGSGLTATEVQAAIDELAGDLASHTHDHGALTGLGDDDHPQYLNETRGDARYSLLGHTHDHGSITGLTDDDHTQYALLVGRATGQTISGGTAAGETLTLHSTTNGTKGKIYLGSSAVYDEANNRIGIGTTSPSTEVDVTKTVAGSVTIQSRNNSTSSSASASVSATADDVLPISIVAYSTTYTDATYRDRGALRSALMGGLVIESAWGAIDFICPADIIFNTNDLFLDYSSGFIGMGTTTPAANLHVVNDSDPVELRVEATSAGDGASVALETAAQEWSYAVNATTGRFTIQDITGATIPVKIDAGADDNLFRLGVVASDIADFGNVVFVDTTNTRIGVGTNAPTSPLDVTGDRVRIRTGYTPTSSSDTYGNTGDFCYDNGYWYWKAPTAGWLRIAGSTF